MDLVVLEKIAACGEAAGVEFKKSTSKELHTILPMFSQRTIQRELGSLKDNKLVDFSGIGTPSVFWTLREE